MCNENFKMNDKGPLGAKQRSQWARQASAEGAQEHRGRSDAIYEGHFGHPHVVVVRFSNSFISNQTDMLNFNIFFYHVNF
jgi:hypothetical protein